MEETNPVQPSTGQQPFSALQPLQTVQPGAAPGLQTEQSPQMTQSRQPMEPTTAQKGHARRETPEEARLHLFNLIRSFDVGMLVTQCEDGSMHSRPMAVAAVDEDETLWFVTSMDTPKMAEISKKQNVNVSFQDGTSKFVSVAGVAERVDDRNKLNQVWSEAWRAYFPQGKDTPTVTLLKVTAKTGEYWDQSSLANKIRFIVEAGKAFLSGRSAEPTRLGDNEKVAIHTS